MEENALSSTFSDYIQGFNVVSSLQTTSRCNETIGYPSDLITGMMADERRLEKRRTLNLLDSRSPSLGPNSLALPPTHHRASTSRAAPSQPIVIYSDDEMEEVKLVPHGYMANGERRAAKAGNGEVGGLDMGARDAIKVALAKLDAEVRNLHHPHQLAQLKSL